MSPKVSPPPRSVAPQPGEGESQPVQPSHPKLRAANINFYYGAFQALHDISLDMHASRITALIGPSGCGKSTFLRTLNRINETIAHSRVEGRIRRDRSAR